MNLSGKRKKSAARRAFGLVASANLPTRTPGALRFVDRELPQSNRMQGLVHDERFLRNALLIELRQKRKPRLLSALPGWLALRLAERVLLALLFQEPPRTARGFFAITTCILGR